MTPAPRMMTSTTVLRSAAFESDRKNRRRVRDYCRRHREEDPILRQAYDSVAGGKDTAGAEVVAAFSISAKRVYVERVGLLAPLSDANAVIHLPSPAANKERSNLSARLLHIESAQRAWIRYGQDLEGLFVAVFETGNQSIDRENKLLIDTLSFEGFRCDGLNRAAIRNVEYAASDLVRGRHSWRTDMKIAFAPPEKVTALAQEKLRVEQWIREIEEVYKDSPAELIHQLLQAVLHLGSTALFRASLAYDSLMTEVSRRIRSIQLSASLSGANLSLDLRPPSNDNEGPAQQSIA